jgi:hypothetical protein
MFCGHLIRVPTPRSRQLGHASCIRDTEERKRKREYTVRDGIRSYKKDDEPLLNLTGGYKPLLKREGTYVYR